MSHSIVNGSRIENLNKENYDTWKIQAAALLVRNDTWEYVSGQKPKPQVDTTTTAGKIALEEWERQDRKAKADIVLCMSPSELKQIKGSETSRQIWDKLESIYASKGPARKSSLLKQLSQKKMNEGDDVRDHLSSFFEIIDKLKSMDIEVNGELQTIMLLHSLPESFENFRCAIESRDDLPKAELLKIKILEETDARELKNRNASGAFYTNNQSTQGTSKKKYTRNDEKSKPSKWNSNMKCQYCKMKGHVIAECRKKKKSENSRNNHEECTFVAQTKQPTNMWCLDSGATSHLCKDKSLFTNIQKIHSGIRMADSTTTPIRAIGNVKIFANSGNTSKSVLLTNALHVPDLHTNLLSVAKLVDKDHTVTFHRQGAVIKDEQGNVKLQIKRKGDLFYLDQNAQQAKSAIQTKSQAENWHRRLGHVNFQDVKFLVNERYIKGPNVEFQNNPPCETCIMGKLTRLPFPKHSETSTTPLGIVHTDLCGPMRVSSHGGARYFLTFTDEYSRWTDVYFLRNKDEVIDKFKEYKSHVENQTGYRIKTLQSDNGKEFCNAQMEDLLKQNGIQRRLTAPYTPQQNGIAERKNRTLIEMARCMLLESGMSPSFWGEAVKTANYIRNRCPSQSLKEGTPYEKRTGRRPNLHFLQVFGCKAFVLNKAPGKGKFDARAIRGRFVGYSEISKAFRIWIPSEKKIRISRDVKFVDEYGSNEYSDFISTNTTSGNHRLLENDIVYEPSFNINQKDIDESKEINETQTPKVNKKRLRGRPSKNRTGLPGRPRKMYRYRETENVQEENPNVKVDENELEFDDSEQTSSENEDGPETDIANFCHEIPFSVALSGPSSDEWKRAICEETKSIIANDVWKIVDRPKDRKVIGSRIVLRNKYKSDGTLDRRKARTVAKGYTQSPGIDYFDSFSPVARLSSFRILMALSSKFNLNVTQLDVTTAYLYGDIDVKLYMELPELFRETVDTILEEEKNPSILIKAREMSRRLTKGNQVCELNRALYGLKQAGRQWHEKLTSVLKEAGLLPTHSDPCMYTDKNEMTFVLVYVDDLLIATKDRLKEKQIIQILSNRFKIKNLGQPKFCLGIEINKTRGSTHLTQSSYIRELLEKFNMIDCKPVSTPLAVGTNLHEFQMDEKDSEPKPPYRALVGALMYLAVATRPDIAHAVSILSQFNERNSNIHWIAAKRVLRYLKGTIDQGLVYAPDEHTLRGYVDADWANNTNDRRSYTGYTFLLAGAAITWESRKQRTVALSSTEAEYLGLSAAAKESIYLIQFMKELGFDSIASVDLFNDNNGAIKLAENASFHPKTKHIDIRHHYIREVLKKEPVTLSHLPTEHMIADVLTKGLPRTKHDYCSRGMGIFSEEGKAVPIKGEC